MRDCPPDSVDDSSYIRMHEIRTIRNIGESRRGRLPFNFTVLVEGSVEEVVFELGLWLGRKETGGPALPQSLNCF